MKSKVLRILTPVILLVAISCDTDAIESYSPKVDPTIMVKTVNVINSNYIGNGAQWDAYPHAYNDWNSPISDADWDKMYARLDFMKPKFMRVITTAGEMYLHGGTYDPEKNLEGLAKILDYCQSNKVTVMFGEWGFDQISTGDLNEPNLEYAARFLDFLVNDKGYTCIKYYNLINEPNGDWAATDGDYDLWQRAISLFYDEMETLGVSDQVTIAGPDIAVWDGSLTNWLAQADYDLGDEIGLYDIHAYPDQTSVRGGQFSETIKAYIEATPAGKDIIMGELGLKFNKTTEAELYNQNLDRIAADEYAGNDSNMMVKDFFYGIDMADATMQVVNAGFSGMVAWGLDDAMHNNLGGDDKQLKVWGFWNILGEELFGGAEEEEIRPWFYSSSLLSRYMQTGAQVFEVELPSKNGVRAIAVAHQGKYMIAVVNSSLTDYELEVKFDSGILLKSAKKYVYSEEVKPVDEAGLPIPLETDLEIDFNEGYEIEAKGQSLVVITNMD
ncbi:hypothetical protein [Reichenbachiella versicolor]|uniref:hypothetical protein n=1 Tax=Reichenbachiella versicolor TaxID=1821036 RepID=UPI0013A581B5|nr:hypothetical protein [Reichenbachiella versicolor]